MIFFLHYYFFIPIPNIQQAINYDLLNHLRTHLWYACAWWVHLTVGNKGMKKKESLWGMEKALYFLTSFAWQNLFIWDDGAAGRYVFVFVLSFLLWKGGESSSESEWWLWKVRKIDKRKTKIISLWPKLHCFFPCYLCSAVYFLAFLEQLYAWVGAQILNFKTKSALKVYKTKS